MRKRNKSGLKVRKPVSVLKADFGGLFKALANALAHSLTLKWEELLPDLAAASAALGLREEPAQLAWLLIRRSLAQAVFEIVGQTPQITPSIGALEQNQSLTDQIDNELASLDTEITRDFFQHPEKLEIVSVLRERITGWLLALGINSARAESAVQRLVPAFVYSLHREWRTHREIYSPILAATETPFMAAAERQQAWEFYYAWLANETSSGVFGESFSLEEIYVPLRAFTVARKVDGATSLDQIEASGRINAPATPVRTVFDLDEHLDEWVDSGSATDSIRVISGGPGSGKSCSPKCMR